MAVTRSSKPAGNLLLRMHPLHRLATCLAFAGISYWAISQTGLGILIKTMIAWAAFALTFSISSWIVFFTRKPAQIREHAQQEDGSRIYVFCLIIITSFASLFAVLLLMLSKEARQAPHFIYVTVAVSGMILSWVMVHSVFTFHYAHLYYGNDLDDPHVHAEGLDFPKEKKPDYVDFAYFSFVIGMTFQVSDVDITSRVVRRMALFHGLVSFVLNTFVVALTINMIASLIQG